MDKEMKRPKSPSGLWTRDFTIITLGSAVSMLGSSMLGFALSLFVLDYTGTAHFYAFFVFLFTLPQIAAPLLAGPLMDRFSRRKTIYLLDFLSAAAYCAFGLLIALNWFHLALLAVMALLIGTINSVYQVAFQSFYPMLIPEGCYSKAYSVSTALETLSAVMIAAAAFLYRAFGIAPLLIVCSGCFFLAALCETRISDVETSLPKAGKPYRLRSFFEDSKAGLCYLGAEKGLLLIAAAAAFRSLAGGASTVVTLPWFRENSAQGEFAYMYVWGFMLIGRVLGSLLQYRWKLPSGVKYGIALGGFTAASMLEGAYLFTPVWAMQGICFAIGLVTAGADNIRVSATQAYVPDRKKGRFNGTFLMLTTLGTLLGELLAGAALTALSLRGTLAAFMGIAALAVLVLIGFGRRYVKPVFNREA